METGNWHGYTAVVLHKDSDNVEFLIGDFCPSELDNIVKGLYNDDPYIWSEYGDGIQLVSQEEWDEQQ